jgi:hypothetical protein
MKRKLLIAVPLLCLVALLAWFFRPKHESLGEAFVSERSVTLWSGVAQVREQLGVLLFGERVEVLARRNDNVKVRTSSGLTGWVDARYLMEPELWQRSTKLLEQTKPLSVQAHGRTKVPANLRVRPGRNEPRLYQFNRGAQIEILGRAVADWVQVSDEKESSGEPTEDKKEDWFLVRGLAARPPSATANAAVRNSSVNTTTQPGDQTVPIAGWVVGRFVSLDLPDPVRDGSNSASIRPIAWFELNRVNDADGDHSQYLVAGTHGPEGQPCDFTTLRVFTWNPRKSRYETAYIENNLCGALPFQVAKDSKGEPEFRFRLMDDMKEERVYRLIQTVVHRVREQRSLKKTSAASTAKSKNP